MIEQRCRNEEEAVAEARDLFDSRHFQSVKVVRETFDQVAKLYRETTVFSLPNGNSDASGPILAGPKKRPNQRPKGGETQDSEATKNSLLDFFRVERVSRCVRAAPALLSHSVR